MAAVDLHVDEPGRDPPAGGVDRPCLSGGAPLPTAVDDATVERARSRPRRRRPGVTTEPFDDGNRHVTAWRRVGGQRRRRGCRAARRPARPRPGRRARARPASATPLGRAVSTSCSSAQERVRRSVMPPPTATTSTSSVIAHSCTAHAVAARTSLRGASDRRATARPEPIASAQPSCPQRHAGPSVAHRDVADLAGAARRAAPQPAAEHEAGGDAGADVDVGERRRRRPAEVGERTRARRR